MNGIVLGGSLYCRKEPSTYVDDSRKNDMRTLLMYYRVYFQKKNGKHY